MTPTVERPPGRGSSKSSASSLISNSSAPGSTAIRTRPTSSAIRRLNLTHMNRGRNAYQASHRYSLADFVVGD
jgi:hypothetical protein